MMGDEFIIDESVEKEGTLSIHHFGIIEYLRYTLLPHHDVKFFLFGLERNPKPAPKTSINIK